MIDTFRGPHAFLSNFHTCHITMDGIDYPSVEHAYQAAKTIEKWVKLHIASAESPGKAKRIGKRVALRADWDKTKLDVMLNLIRLKFQDPDLRQQLLDTDNGELIEGNKWGDTWWGVCNGRGENHLGKILMQVRDEIRNAKCPTCTSCR